MAIAYPISNAKYYLALGLLVLDLLESAGMHIPCTCTLCMPNLNILHI